MFENLKNLHEQGGSTNARFDAASKLTGALIGGALGGGLAQQFNINSGAIIPIGILAGGLLGSTINRVRAGYSEVMKKK
ncbi:hypothetical protein KBD33_04630 [Candidatus Gracilibacteria bacterium]|nr:hypothetical protein [Candidatus Gracilibacteria bacterium]